jgi:hypothetical protein
VGNVNKSIFEFMKVIDGVYGLYLDSTSGYKLLNNQIINFQQKAQKLLSSPLTTAELDERGFIYGKGHPDNTNFLHITTQGKLKKRNEKNGTNFRVIANLLVVLIHQYWEDFYRGKIAALNGLKKDDLQSDVFGDLKQFRHSIIHNRGKATWDQASKVKLFKWFKRGEEIFLNENQVLEIVTKVKDYLSSLKIKG